MTLHRHMPAPKDPKRSLERGCFDPSRTLLVLGFFRVPGSGAAERKGKSRDSAKPRAEAKARELSAPPGGDGDLVHVHYTSRWDWDLLLGL